jgi:hypothetical protein
MTFMGTIKATLRPDGYERIEGEAQQEVALAMQMQLKDDFGQDRYYSPRLLLREFESESERFRKAKLPVLPADILRALFRCKLLRAVKDEKEFQQRMGIPSLFENRALFPHWADKATPLADSEDRCVSVLQTDIRERTLVTHVSSLHSPSRGGGVACSHQEFFDDLVRTLQVPIVSFMDEDLTAKHRHLEPGLPSYGPDKAKNFFSAPSLGSTIQGTEGYCFWYGTVWLRTFLNMLRIAGFIYPGQREFTLDAKMEPPTFPVFLERHAQGMYQWKEDEKPSWKKLADGCLFRSWGFRGFSNMWIDRRNIQQIKQFMLDHKSIFENLENPWNDTSTKDVAPILDILSSATQIPDLGAKILLIYCCLEHMFVPSNIGTENKKYIQGGLNALRPQLNVWLNDLYEKRCDYAHKGFVLRTDKTLTLITDSIKNVMSLLIAKLSVC